MTQRPIIRLSTEIIITIHSELIDKIGGGHGIRDNKLLDMTVNSVFQTFDGNDLYPTIIDKAAHLAYSLIKNHPFLDGNKRIGVTPFDLTPIPLIYLHRYFQQLFPCVKGWVFHNRFQEFFQDDPHVFPRRDPRCY